MDLDRDGGALGPWIQSHLVFTIRFQPRRRKYTSLLHPLNLPHGHTFQSLLPTIPD